MDHALHAEGRVQDAVITAPCRAPRNDHHRGARRRGRDPLHLTKYLGTARRWSCPGSRARARAEDAAQARKRVSRADGGAKRRSSTISGRRGRAARRGCSAAAEPAVQPVQPLPVSGTDGRTSIAAKGLTGEGSRALLLGHGDLRASLLHLPRPEIAVRSCATAAASSTRRARAAEMSQRGALLAHHRERRLLPYYPAGTRPVPHQRRYRHAFESTCTRRRQDPPGGARRELLFETARLWADLGLHPTGRGILHQRGDRPMGTAWSTTTSTRTSWRAKPRTGGVDRGRNAGSGPGQFARMRAQSASHRRK
jgi:hypothetical protein